MRNLETLNKYRLTKKELELYGIQGDSGNGIFEIQIGAKWFHVIASNGLGWEHVSVTPSTGNSTPSWNDMCHIKKLFFKDGEVAIQIHPRERDYVNAHKNCLHLWRPTNAELPLPPMIFV